MKHFPQFQGKKVLVFGLGLNDGGLGMVDFFLDQGAVVTVTDGKTEEQLATTIAKINEKGLPVTYHLGGHVESDFTDNDLIIRNPAIKPDNQYLEIARKAGKQIEMEMSLFYSLAPGKIIGISGTKGKSTTTTLTYLFLKKQYGNRVVLAGNIGKSAIRELPNLTEDSITVLEISSFQLDALREAQRSPHIALLTNIYEDHLNWHNDLADYEDTKKALFRYQTSEDIACFNLDDNKITELFRDSESTKAKRITFSSKDTTANYFRDGTEIRENGKKLITLEKLQVDGEHNFQNALGAISLVRQLGVSIESIQHVIETFTGVEGREQLIREINGVKIYNDTTATALESMIVAMKRFGPNNHQKIIMISGGMDKGVDYSAIAPYWEKDLKALVLLEGTASEKIATMMEGKATPVFKFFGKFDDAVQKAFSLAESGDMMILCPGAASFNMFVNEFDRGRQFTELVNKL